MSGEVLYRKWRPPRFADIVGQAAVIQTLTQAVATGRTSHAYLLCGPRGTGKTSTARVLAKALNCTMRPPGVGDPCGACDSCRAVDQGAYVDLIEIDAASNRGIDEMRDLREKVRFSPTMGTYKVYIIDEAHMLTPAAFNAFLKTLEEPPPHVVFVLATTEAHQLPATITSRCQRFDFHRIAPSNVVERLAEIAMAESVDVSPEVLRTISRVSGGSLRDATNLLDQLITSFGANISIEQVQELLGMDGEDRALALVKHLLSSNTKAALEVINTVGAEGQDIRPLHRMTVDFLRAALLMKSGVKDAMEISKEASTELSFASSNTTLEHLLRALRLFGQVSLKFDQPSPLPLELATVELGLEPRTVATAATAPTPSVAGQQPKPRPQGPPNPPAPDQRDERPRDVSLQSPSRSESNSTAQPSAPQHRDTDDPTPPSPESNLDAPAEELLITQWPTILRGLSRVPKKRFDIGALLRSSSQHVIEGNEVVVRFAQASNSERLQDELDNPQCRIEVERILTQGLGKSFSLRIEADDSRRPLARSGTDQPGHLIRAAMSFGGEVIQEGVPALASQPSSQAPMDSSSTEPPIVEAAITSDGEPSPVPHEPPLLTTEASPIEAYAAPDIIDPQNGLPMAEMDPTVEATEAPVTLVENISLASDEPVMPVPESQTDMALEAVRAPIDPLVAEATPDPLFDFASLSESSPKEPENE